MTKWSLAYELLRIVLRQAFTLFYKRVQSNGNENIPQEKPIIFAANHQNALIDPLAILYSNSKQSVFLTRADVFNNPILLKIFTFLKMLPVYRIRDGADSLRNNERIFNKSKEILEAKMSVALFPEAQHTNKRHLLPLKKAVPRIAFLAEEENNFELDLQIVPVGIYYENYVQSNSNLYVNYGKPIPLKQFEEIYLDNNQKGYQALKVALEEALIPLIIHIPDMENYDLYDFVRLYHRPKMKRELGCKSQSPKENFNADQNTIKRLHDSCQKNSKLIEILAEKWTSHKYFCKKLSINELDTKKPSSATLLGQLILYLISAPVYIYALINLYVYYYFSLKFIKKIKDPQFHSSIKYGIVIIIAPLIFMIHGGIFWVVSGSGLMALTYLISLPVAAVLANKYRYGFIKFKNKIRHWKVATFDKDNYKQYANNRQELSMSIENSLK